MIVRSSPASASAAATAGAASSTSATTSSVTSWVSGAPPSWVSRVETASAWSSLTRTRTAARPPWCCPAIRSRSAPFIPRFLRWRPPRMPPPTTPASSVGGAITARTRPTPAPLPTLRLPSLWVFSLPLSSSARTPIAFSLTSSSHLSQAFICSTASSASASSLKKARTTVLRAIRALPVSLALTMANPRRKCKPLFEASFGAAARIARAMLRDPSLRPGSEAGSGGPGPPMSARPAHITAGQLALELPAELPELALAPEWKDQQRLWGHTFHPMCSYLASFPAALTHAFIARYSRPGDVVLDPFSGRGTTALQACAEGRIGVGNDLNPFAHLLTAAKVEPATRADAATRLAALRLGWGAAAGGWLELAQVVSAAEGQALVPAAGAGPEATPTELVPAEVAVAF